MHEFIERAEGKQIAVHVSDGSRQTGDWTTYKYYTRTLGSMSLVLFLSAVAVNEVASGMQCMSPHNYDSRCLTLTIFSCMVKLVGTKQRAW